MSSDGCLLILSGPSGAGKTTLCDRLVEDGLACSVVTCTTREPREGETQGVHYHFLSRQEFEDSVSQGDFVEHAEVHGNLYGIRRKDIEEGLGKGERLLLNIDVQGSATLRETFADRLFDVFVDIPSLETLRQRLAERGQDSEAVIEGRLENARLERERKNEFAAVVVNDDLEACYQKIKNLLSDRKEYHVH